MLSIAKIGGSAGFAANYYLNEEKNYYLSEQGIGNSSEWIGNGAQRNGLLGKAVEQEVLEQFLSGRAYDGEVATAPNGKHKAGWDFTFSAPKTVSLLGLKYGNKEVINAHDSAVRVVVKQIEKDAAQYRVCNAETKGKDFHNSDNITAAMVRHATSRENDPQMHTHVLVCNMTYDQEGMLRAMASERQQSGDVVNGMAERVFRDQKFYTALYQSVLAKSVKELGFQVQGVGNGQFEVQGIPEALVKEFSQRRLQIVEQAKIHGVKTAQGMDVSTQATRQAKSYESIDALQADWDERALKHGAFNPENIRNQATQELASSHAVLEHAKDSLEMAFAYLGHTQTEMTYAKLMEVALGHFSMDKKVTLSELNDVLNQKLDDGSIIPLDKEQTRYTTEELINKEQALSRQTQQQLRGVSLDVSEKTLNQLSLDNSNKQQLVSLLANSKQVNVVNIKGGSRQFLAGMLHSVENSKGKISVLSANNPAKNQLTKEVERQSRTLKQWMRNHFREDCHDTVGHFLYAHELTGKSDTKGQKIVVVDQANYLGVDEVSKLIKATQEQKSKLVLINHESKLKGVKFGNVFETLKKSQANHMDWKNNQYSDAIINISLAADEKKQVKQISETYAVMNDQERAKTYVLSNTKAGVNKLNHAIRTSLQDKGDVGRIEQSFMNANPVFLSEEEKQVAKHYKPGHIIKLFADKQVFRYRIKSVDKTDNQVVLGDEKGKLTRIDAKTLAKKNFSVLDEKPMYLAQGEKIRPVFNLKHLGMKAGEHLTVNKLGRFAIKFKNAEGKSIYVDKKTMEGQSFQYDYAVMPRQMTEARNHTMLMSKSYAAKSDLLASILDKTGHKVDIFTEDEHKLKVSLGQSRVQTTAINTVIKAAHNTQHVTGIEKFIGADTRDAMQSDLTAAISHIKQSVSRTVIDKAMDYAIGKIGEKEAAFRHQDLVTQALHYALKEEGSPLNKDDIDRKIVELQGKAGILSSEYSDGVRWVTHQSLETENRIIDSITQGKGAVPAFTDQATVENYLKDSGLTGSQQEAVLMIATTSDRFTAIQGLPGTGKSTMLADAVKVIQTAQEIAGKG